MAYCKLLVLAFGFWCMRADAQGLLGPEDYSNLGASAAEQRFATSYKAAKQAKSKYRENPRGNCDAKGATLCSQSDDSLGSLYAQLLMATSPVAYNSKTPADTGGFSCVGPARDQQGCATCTSMSVVAAAEAAVACGSRGSYVRLSEQDHYFCGPLTGNKFQRMCDSGWSMSEALGQLTARATANQLVKQACLPYQPDPTMELTRAELCNYKCKQVDPVAANGTFDVIPIGSYWVAQRHIRRYGSVITRININLRDFKAFFAQNPDGVYMGPGPGVNPDTAHAVVFHGYDNNKSYWVCLNSWGPNFGVDGSFKITYGVCGMMAAGETYGITWTPNDKTKLMSIVEELPTQKGCYKYTGRAGESIALIAEKMWGRGLQPIQQLLRDNINVISELDGNVVGKTFKICKPQNASVVTPLDPRNAVTFTERPKGPRAGCSGSALHADVTPYGIDFIDATNQEIAQVLIYDKDECCKLCTATPKCQMWSFHEHYLEIECYMYELRDKITMRHSSRSSGGIRTSGRDVLATQTSACGGTLNAWLLKSVAIVPLGTNSATDPSVFPSKVMQRKGLAKAFKNGLMRNTWQECCKQAVELNLPYWTYGPDKKCWLFSVVNMAGPLLVFQRANSSMFVSGVIGNDMMRMTHQD